MVSEQKSEQQSHFFFQTIAQIHLLVLLFASLTIFFVREELKPEATIAVLFYAIGVFGTFICFKAHNMFVKDEFKVDLDTASFCSMLGPLSICVLFAYAFEAIAYLFGWLFGRLFTLVHFNKLVSWVEKRW